MKRFVNGGFRAFDGIFHFNWIKDPKYRFWGFTHDYYDGDFYSFGFWFFNIAWTNNPHCSLTDEEIKENIARWEREHGKK